MAKGLEDTAFYIYNRLAALNEVGGEPQHFGISVEDFHAQNSQRQRDWPATLLATSTHDTKRSEDVRARILAISEVPQLWRSSLQRWRVINRRLKREVDEASAPDPNEEYLFYQTLLGSWPLGATEATPEYIERIQAYMAKALKEAKMNTSWIQPNEQWDSAMSDFVARVLEPSSKNKFVPVFLPVAEEIARLGAINSLSQVALKLTVPGVPDIYQGTEVWNFSLVDPDNRRPVDYKERREMLASLETASTEELLREWPDGRIKLMLTQRLLRFRRENPLLFQRGSYLPLTVTGEFADCCVAFARKHESKWIVVLVPRLSSRIGFPPIGEKWRDTAVELPESLDHGAAKDVLTGREVARENGALRVSEALAILPFAACIN
jgi:(1->4)-alpha-D-glucan 1-alpha-D-glucosylmutase